MKRLRDNQLFLLVLIFFIGFTSLVYEIYSVKVLFMFIAESTAAASISISAFLAGLAFSSLFFSRNFWKKMDPFQVLVIMQFLVAIYALLILRNLEIIPWIIDSAAQAFPKSIATFFKFTLFWIFLFIPAFFIGGSFPLVNDLYIRNDLAEKSTVTIYFWDTIGSLIGALLTGFLFIPYWGLVVTISIPISINLLLCVFLSQKNSFKIIFSLYLILLPIYIFSKKETIDINESQNTYSFEKVKNDLDKKLGKIVFQKNSPYGVITVGDGALDIKGNRGLFVNYRDMCHSLVNQSEKMMGRVTADHLRKKSHVLNIGLGCGFTANGIASNENVYKLDIAEINPVVAEAAKYYFTKENNDVLKSPKVALFIKDGSEFIRQAKNKYDAVIIDIEEVSIVYSSLLYTQDYFKIIKSKLNSNGVLALWSFYVSPDFSKVIYNTLRSVFPYVTMKVWEGNITFYGTLRPLLLKDENKIKDKEEIKLINYVLSSPIKEINTIENRTLEKYFNINKQFGLPGSYFEKYYTK